MNANPRIDFSKIKAPGLFHVAGWLLLLGCAIMLWNSIPDVFPETITMARTALIIGLLGASFLIGITCYGVGAAAKLASILGFACTLVMVANVASHWLMARALNVAHVYEIQSREEREEKSRLDDAENKRQVEKLNAQSNFNKSVAVADNAATNMYRQTGVKPKQGRTLAAVVAAPTPQPTATPVITDAFGKVKVQEPPKYDTRKEVYSTWVWICSILAILDLLLPVGGVGACLFRWELDLNRNNIPDSQEVVPGK